MLSSFGVYCRLTIPWYSRISALRKPVKAGGSVAQRSKIGTMYSSSSDFAIINPKDVSTRNILRAGVPGGNLLFFNHAGVLLQDTGYQEKHLNIVNPVNGQLKHLFVM
jgi:hypothetical protein